MSRALAIFILASGWAQAQVWRTDIGAPTPSGRTAIVDLAKHYLGIPYVWGGTTPSGFDCSGFVYYVFNLAGIRLDRSAALQAMTGSPVRIEDALPGDLLFFRSGSANAGDRVGHVGIYVGGGSFIHATRNGRTKAGAVMMSRIGESHYMRTLIGIRRVVAPGATTLTARVTRGTGASRVRIIHKDGKTYITDSPAFPG
jgi:cell wall-associated NlpC family hydrolase